jgi:hypothetical protein
MALSSYFGDRDFIIILFSYLCIYEYERSHYRYERSNNLSTKSNDSHSNICIIHSCITNMYIICAIKKPPTNATD